MTVECALAKLCYLLSKPLTPDQIRKLIPISLRGELTPPNVFTTHSTSLDAADRLRSLLGKVIASSGSGGSSNVSQEEGVEEYKGVEWSATTDSDAEKAENALMPFLLSTASSKSDNSLQNLIKSLELNPGSTIELLSVSTNVSLHTPLHLAVFSSSVRNLEILLMHGANLHARDFECHTALYYAARVGRVVGMEMVRILKDAGANLGETEIERGDVGLEILRAEKRGEGEIWRLAAGTRYLIAKEVARKLFA